MILQIIVVFTAAILSFYTSWKVFIFYQKIGQKRESIFPYKDIKHKLKNNLLKKEDLIEEAKELKFLSEATFISYAVLLLYMFAV